MSDFKENYLFNVFKDTPIKSATMFKTMIFDKFKMRYENVTSLYMRVVNYQIKKYGSQLRDIKYQNFVKNFNGKSSKSRNTRGRRFNLNKETNKIIERNGV